MLDEAAREEAEVRNELEVPCARQSFELFADELVAGSERGQMRREVDLERHVRAEVCAGVRHLRHHVAVTARVEQLAKELEVEVRL